MSVPGPPNITQIPFASPNMLEFEWNPPLIPNGTILGYRFTINGSQTILGADTRYYAATGLTNGETYFTSLEASNTNGWGTPANFRNYQPGSEPTQGPSSFTVSTFGSNALASWTPPAVLPDAQILWYALYAEDTYLNASFSYTANGLTQSNYYIKNLSSMADYYNYSIYAVNCPGWSPVVSYPAPKQRGLPLWTTKLGGGSNQNLTNEAIATDINNNIYIASEYISTIFIYNYTSAPVNNGSVGLTLYGTLSNPSGTTAETCLIKYNSSGTVQWVSRVGFGFDQLAPTLATDTSGNIFISGVQNGSATTTNVQFYNPGSVSSNSTITTVVAGNMSTVSATNDIYLAKYNSSGTFQWATVIGSANNELNQSICTDPFGNVFIAGDYNGTTTIKNAGTPDVNLNVATTTYGTMITAGSNDTFLVKYNSSGAVQWATRLGSTGSESNVSITSDISGNVYVLNSYNNTALGIYNKNDPSGGVISTILYGTMAFTGASASIPDIALVKYNSTGSAQWATRLSATSNSDFPQSVTTDSLGNVYVAAQYYSPTLFTLYNSATPVGTTITPTSYGTIPNSGPSGTADICLVKYDSTGSAQWATRIGSSGIEGSTVLTTDSSNNLYVAGITNTSTVVVVYDKSTPDGSKVITPVFYANLSNTIATTAVDTFLVKYNSDGNAQWGTMLGGTGTDATPSLSADSGGNVYISGYYDSTTFRINKPSLTPSLNNSTIGLSLYGTLSNDGANDIYLIKFQT